MKYIVLIEDIANLPLVAKEYIVLLTFIDRANGTRTLKTKANEFRFSANAKEFREYFGIQYRDNLGDTFKQFYAYLGTFISTSHVRKFDTETKQAIVNKLSHNDGENIDHICCYAAKRNGTYNGIQHHKTPFNRDKTKLLRENLFSLLGSDDTISFCYRKENSINDTEIYFYCAQRYGNIFSNIK